MTDPPEIWAPPTAQPETPPPTRRSRRWLLFAILPLLAAAVVGVVIVTTRDGDDGGGTDGGLDGDPHLVALDRVRDRLEVSDLDGANSVTIELPEDFLPLGFGPAGKWLVGRPNDDQLPYVNLLTGVAMSVDLPDDDSDVAYAPGSDHAFIYHTAGGEILVADLDRQTLEAIGDPDGTYTFNGFVDGRAVILGDQGETLLVPVDDPGSWTKIPGFILDADGTTALVATRTGETGALQLFRDGAPVGEPLALDKPARGGVLEGDRALVVDEDASLFIVDLGAGTATPAGDVGDELLRAAPIADDRLFVTTTSGSALVQIDGTSVRSFPTDTGDFSGEPVGLSYWGVGTRCVSVQAGTGVATDHAEVIDAESGKTLAELDTAPFAVSADGCDVITQDEPAQVVIDAKRVELPDREILSAVPSPDGSVIAIRARGDDGIENFLYDRSGDDERELEPDVIYFFATF